MTPVYAETSFLYTASGGRKYLNSSESRRFLSAASILKPGEKLFVLTLVWTGARVSEVLALTPLSFQAEPGVAAIRTLKRRRSHVREVPIPGALMGELDRFFQLGAAQRDPLLCARHLWPFSRTTAWRLVKRVMKEARLFGEHACPKGLRHAFGVATLGVVPLNVRQKWMGHARSETTDIYSAVCGPEEMAFAQRFWAASATGACSG